MRKNNGQNDNNPGQSGSINKEREAENNRSERPPHQEKETEAHGGDVQPPNSDDAGAPRAPETGEPENH